MERFISKTGTILAYLLTFITWDDITAFFAVILTIVMTVYYGYKTHNERLLCKQLKNKNDPKSLSK